MASRKAISMALSVLLEAGMIPAFQAGEINSKIDAWEALLLPSMGDRILGEAVQRVASQGTYGACKPADINQAAKTITGERVRAWRELHGEPDSGTPDPISHIAYLNGFWAAIGNGAPTESADQHGRAALAWVTNHKIGPLQGVSELKHHIEAGRIPWSNLIPPPRPLKEITPPTTTPATPKASLARIEREINDRKGH